LGLYIVDVNGVLLSLVVSVGVGGAAYLFGAYVTNLLGARKMARKAVGQIL
jgi:hypothetical protein